MRDSGRPPYHSEHTRLEYVSRITITRSMRSWRGVLFYPSACLPVLCCPPPLRCMRRLVLTPTHLHLGTHARTHARTGPARARRLSVDPEPRRWIDRKVQNRWCASKAKAKQKRTDRGHMQVGRFVLTPPSCTGVVHWLSMYMKCM